MATKISVHMGEPSGSNVRKTEQHATNAKEGADWNSKNEQKPYVPPAPTIGKTGGKANNG